MLRWHGIRSSCAAQAGTVEGSGAKLRRHQGQEFPSSLNNRHLPNSNSTTWRSGVSKVSKLAVVPSAKLFFRRHEMNFMEYETLLLPSYVQNSMKPMNTMKIISKIRATLDRFKNALAAFAVTEKRSAVGLVVSICNLNFDTMCRHNRTTMLNTSVKFHKYVILLTSGSWVANRRMNANQERRTAQSLPKMESTRRWDSGKDGN